MKPILKSNKMVDTKVPKNIFNIQKIGLATKITLGQLGRAWENCISNLRSLR